MDPVYIDNIYCCCHIIIVEVVVVYRRCAEEFGGRLVVGDGIYAITFVGQGSNKRILHVRFRISGVKRIVLN